MSIEHGGPSPEEMGLSPEQQFNEMKEGNETGKEYSEDDLFDMESQIMTDRAKGFVLLENITRSANNSNYKEALEHIEAMSQRYKELADRTRDGGGYRKEATFLAGVALAIDALNNGENEESLLGLLRDIGASSEIQAKFLAIARSPEKAKKLIDAEGKLEHIRELYDSHIHANRITRPDGSRYHEESSRERLAERAEELLNGIMEDLNGTDLTHEFGRNVGTQDTNLSKLRGFATGGWLPALPKI